MVFEPGLQGEQETITKAESCNEAAQDKMGSEDSSSIKRSQRLCIRITGK